tara:strand:- start:1636 stop:1872 length:237 start_codon:yes stop_codon:yes gene_type:complete
MTDAEFAAQEVRDQLKSRRTYKEQTVYQTRSQFYNRNTFTVRTGDKLADQTRTYCQKKGINPNVFINDLLTNFFQTNV